MRASVVTALGTYGTSLTIPRCSLLDMELIQLQGRAQRTQTCPRLGGVKIGI